MRTYDTFVHVQCIHVNYQMWSKSGSSMFNVDMVLDCTSCLHTLYKPNDVSHSIFGNQISFTVTLSSLPSLPCDLFLDSIINLLQLREKVV